MIFVPNFLFKGVPNLTYLHPKVKNIFIRNNVCFFKVYLLYVKMRTIGECKTIDDQIKLTSSKLGTGGKFTSIFFFFDHQ
jgi:hypothetical protein